MILRINIDEDEASIEEIVMESGSKIIKRGIKTVDVDRYSERSRAIDLPDLSNLKVVARVTVAPCRVGQLDNGMIIVEVDGTRRAHKFR